MIDDVNKNFICEVLTIWDNLSIQEKNLILNNSKYLKYKEGENIHGGDGDCAGILLIKSGELRTYLLSEEGKEVTLYRLEKGDVCILSASCILNSITFDVFIDATKDSEVVIISASAFQKICSENIYAENFSLKQTVDRFSDVMWAMQQILFMSFDKRLSIFLLDETAKTGIMEIKMTHDQIAKYIGSAREVVSRMLKYFEKEGLVELSRGEVKVIDKNRLRDII